MSAFAGAGGLGVGVAHYRLDRQSHYEAVMRAELEAELAAARRQLDLERRLLIVERYGLEALDRHDGFGVGGHLSGFSVEGEYVDLRPDDWFGVD